MTQSLPQLFVHFEWNQLHMNLNYYQSMLPKSEGETEAWCTLAERSNSVPVPEIGEKDDEPTDDRHNEVV